MQKQKRKRHEVQAEAASEISVWSKYPDYRPKDWPKIPHTKGFAPIDDFQMYYEIKGTGEPIVMIHGGSGSALHWESYIQPLSEKYMVIAADSRGQGNSTEGAGPITYGRIADDHIKLLDYLRIQRAHFVGHSSGAVASLHLLVDHPDRVATATLIGCIYHVENYDPAAYKEMKGYLDAILRGEAQWPSTRATGSRDLSPSVWRKLAISWLTQPTFSLGELKMIDRPVLVVKGGKDHYMKPDVFDTMHANIPTSKLLDLPEATHYSVWVDPDLQRILDAIRELIAEHPVLP